MFNDYRSKLINYHENTQENATTRTKQNFLPRRISINNVRVLFVLIVKIQAVAVPVHRSHHGLALPSVLVLGP